MEALAQILLNTLVPGALFGFVAASFTLIHRTTKVLHLAHGGVVLAAAYAYLWGTQRGIHVLLAAAIAIAVATACGLACSAFVYEPLRYRRAFSSIGSLIAAFALLLVVEGGILLAFGSRARSADPLLTPRAITIVGATITSWQVAMAVMSLVAAAALAGWLRWSRLGTAMRAVADHDEVAAVVGVNPQRVRIVAMAIASALAGVAGILFAGEYTFEPRLSVLVALKAFTRSIIGGVGSVPGALVGSFLVEGAENAWSWFGPASFREIISLLLITITLLFRPWGLFGKKPT